MRDFFYLQRNDRRAILALLTVIVLAVTAMVYVGSSSDKAADTSSDSISTAPSVGRSRTETIPAAEHYAVEGRAKELFPFDPNTADSTTLLRLGLAPWQVRNIYRYRASGGTYSRPRDFARLYGLTAGQYRRLEPYIRIAEEYRPAAEVYAAPKQETYRRDTVRYPLKLKQGEKIALNSADTALLKRVPGIGSSFSKAIVNYRDRLGGYFSVSQLLEIDNFPQSSLPFFTIDTAPCRRLNINKMTLSELRRHPYLGFYRAKTIVEHRRLHGPIQSLQDLSLYRDFPPEAIERLAPYVEF